MKTMTCKQLGGACELEFRAETFEEIAELSRNHGMDMFKKDDSQHMQAMQKMQELMKSPSELEKWLQTKEKEFNDLPDDK